MLLDGGNALKQMIDFLGEAGLALDEPLQSIELPVNSGDLLSEIGKAVIDTSQSGSDSVKATFDEIETLMYPFEFVQYDPTKSFKIRFNHILELYHDPDARTRLARNIRSGPGENREIEV
jgi:hypothetical protein